jgi:2-amino-4-hydroxy-6-hydroxymethyldihydropteridine diphosphokinase
MEIAFGLGSNLGDRLANLIMARDILADQPRLIFKEQSSVYQTSPVGMATIYKDIFFLNCVILFETCVLPSDAISILDKVKEIESAMGRSMNDIRNQPRVIDIDILFFGQEIINTERLTLPHPSISERRFVLEPLAELRPNLILPNATLNIADMLTSLQSADQKVSKFVTDW